jgi:hypothetical protein
MAMTTAHDPEKAAAAPFAAADFASIPGVADVELLVGAEATAATPPSLLVEVPHGADERRHYDALRARLVGKLPDELHCFFHINTDVGAFAIGRQTALDVLAAEPARTALVVRSLIPRTFVDCNRPADYGGGNLKAGGLTAGIPAYVRDEADLVLLRDLHHQYVELARRAFAAVGDRGGFALVPHTYGPRSMGISGVGDDIVEQLKKATAPGTWESWPERAPVDLLTRDGAGRELSPPGLEARLLVDFTAAGLLAHANNTYYVHESSLAWTWATTWPGRLLALEVRRDLLVQEFLPFDETLAIPAKVAPVARVLAAALVDTLRAAG